MQCIFNCTFGLFSGFMADLFENTGYITIGYYKRENDGLGQSVINMTERLAEISKMNAQSHVLDLGCGRGRPILDIALKIGCSVVGVDLAEGHVKMAKESKEEYEKDKDCELKAEFYAASYFDLPKEVTNQVFSHVMMQTSLFYAHHRINEVLQNISNVLKPGGVFVATDFVRVGDISNSRVIKFIEMNSMKGFLSLGEMKEHLLNNALEYTNGENLDHHCIKCNVMKTKKVIQDKLTGPSTEFFTNREETVRDKLASFQIIMAKKKNT